jgi:hypothetical protein
LLSSPGIAFVSADRTTLTGWGGLPHIVRTGAVDLAVTSAVPGLKLFACDHAGNRRRELPVAYGDGVYSFRAEIGPDSPWMVYELSAQ